MRNESNDFAAAWSYAQEAKDKANNADLDAAAGVGTYFDLSLINV